MDKLLYGLGVMVIGMVIVFVGLVILIGCVKLLGLLNKDRRPKASSIADSAPPVQSAPALEVAPAIQLNNAPLAETDPGVIAAITAAIACLWQEDTGFVVRRIARINNSPAWQKAGREEQTYSHL